MDMKGLVVPKRRKFVVSGNIPPNNIIAQVMSTGARRREKRSAAKFSAYEQGRRQNECVDVRRREFDDFTEEGGHTGADNERPVTGAVYWQSGGKFEERRNVRWLD